MSAKVRAIKLLMAVDKTEKLLTKINEFYSNYYRKKSSALPNWESEFDKIWPNDLEPWSSEVKTILKPYIIEKFKQLYSSEHKLVFKVPVVGENVLKLRDPKHPWRILKNKIYKLYDLSMFQAHDYIGDQITIEDDAWNSAEKSSFTVKALRPTILINPKNNVRTRNRTTKTKTATTRSKFRKY
jgi:hypothetical protein